MNGATELDGKGNAVQERRAHARIRKVRITGRLTVSGIERACRVRDLTPLGMGLEGQDLPLPGQRVSIRLDGMARTSAVVIWRDPGRCGLRFEVDQGSQPIFANDA